MISEIKSEKELKKRIITIISKYKKENKTKRYIFLRFVQSNSQTLNFVVTFLNDNFEKEHIYFICIIHIRRYFDINQENKSVKIYNVPNLYGTIEQLFIDN